MAAVTANPIAPAPLHPRRRRHSKQHRIESVLHRLGEEWQGGPTALARIAAEQLSEAVTKQEARLVLLQSKLPAQVPIPTPPEVAQFRLVLSGMWRHPDQIVYISTMKFDSNARLRRRASVDLAPNDAAEEEMEDAFPALLPPTYNAALESTPDVVEVVGALAVLDQRDSTASVGLLTCSVSIDPLTPDAVCAWVERDLVPLLGAFPGRRSLVVCDDVPILRGRAWQTRLSNVIGTRGSHCFVRPLLCQDFEPLERVWDEVLVALHQNSTGPMSSRRSDRFFRLKDTNVAFNAARLPRNILEGVMSTVTQA